MTASMIYPACEIDENAMNRFSSLWRIAMRFAMVIERTMSMFIICCHCCASGAKTFMSSTASVNAAAPLEMTLR